MLASALAEDLHGLLHRQRGLVDARRDERVEDVADRHDARRPLDLLAGEAVRVAAAVPLLVVLLGDDAARLDEHALPRVGEDRGAEEGVPLHGGELLGRELTGLAHDRVVDADLADVVQRRGVQDQLDLRGGEAGELREARGAAAHPHEVRAGVGVAVLRRSREAEGDLVRVVAGPAERLREVGRPAGHLLFERAAHVAEQLVVLPDLEVVHAAEPELLGVEGLADEVVGAEQERALLLVGVRGEHEDGDAPEALVGRRAHRLEHLVAGHPGHLEIEQHDVDARALREHLQRAPTIGRADELDLRLALLEHRREQVEVELDVVDREDPAGARGEGHGASARE